LKLDVEEKNQKLEATILQFQKKPTESSNTASQMEMMKMVENQYKDKITSMQESHQALIQELQEKNTTLHNNYNKLFEKHQLLSKEQEKGFSSSLRKINELTNAEKKLMDQIVTLKGERDRKMIEHQEQLEADRENYKKKLHDVETKARESD